MPIFEYYSYEDEQDDIDTKNRGNLFDGRWIVKKDYDDYPGPLLNESDDPDTYNYLELTDLYGHQDPIRLILPSGGEKLQLLSENLALLKEWRSFERPQKFHGLGLDWKMQKIIAGETVLEGNEEWDEAVVVDRAGPLPNGDICFLLIQDTGQDKPFEFGHHCRLDAQNLSIFRDNWPIPLDADDFNCIDLNGDIISGLSKSLLEIKRYNLRTRKLVDSIIVQGLPSTISCLWHKFQSNVNLTPRGAWTDNYLFVWSNEGTEYPDDDDDDDNYDYMRNRSSSVYHVNLKTGVATATALNFKGWIKEFVVGPDGNHLFIRVDEYLRRSNNRDFKYPYYPPIFNFRYLRVPFNCPESLFFLATVALPRPLSPLALEILEQNSKTAPIPVKLIS